MSASGRYVIYAAATALFLAMLILMDYAVFRAQGLALLYNG